MSLQVGWPEGHPALEPLIALYEKLDSAEGSEVAFILANLRPRDQRVLNILLDRLEYDVSDAIFLLGLYGDPAARPAIEKKAGELGEVSETLRNEFSQTLEQLREASTPEHSEPAHDSEQSY